MNLPAQKTIRFVHPSTGEVLDVAEPTVSQIEALLSLEPDAAGDTPDTRRTLAQLRVLLTPAAPWGFTFAAWANYWRARRRASRFLAGISYRSTVMMVNTMLFAIHGINPDDMDAEARARAEELAKKKADAAAGDLSPTSAT